MPPKSKNNMSDDEKIEQMRKRYKDMDKNGDGLLDFQELKDMLVKGSKGGISNEEATKLYNAVDSNGDGKVSFDEFVNWIYKGNHGQNRSTAGRHDRLAAAGGPTNDGTEESWEPCKRTFENFAGQDMDGKEFNKFCKDNKLFGKGFQKEDVDLTFAKVCPKGKRRVDFDGFKDLCRLIAGKRNISNRQVQEIIENSSGPKIEGTKAEYTKFHDDKSTYTGAHATDGRHGGAGDEARTGRHEAMEAKRQSQLENNAADEDAWDEVERVFNAFSGKSRDLDGREFYNMCMNIDGLVHGKFIKEDVDGVFAKVCVRGQRSIGFDQFKEAVGIIAIKKGQPTHVVQGCIARSNGPTMHGTTQAEYTKFHDDKNQYTGTHATDGRHGLDAE